MLSRLVIPEGEKVLKIEVREGDDVRPEELRQQHCAYEIVITTDRRELSIQGCHDAGPDFDPEPMELELVS